MRNIIGFAAMVALVSVNSFALNADAPLGVWTVQNQKARVEITRAADGALKGEIVWLKEPNYPDGDAEAGKAKHDRKNPDESLRGRPLLGLQVLSGFKFNGEDVWKGGTIYDAESGKTYKCKMSMDGNNTLEVRGYIGVSLLGRTDVWTRYTEGK